MQIVNEFTRFVGWELKKKKNIYVYLRATSDSSEILDEDTCTYDSSETVERPWTRWTDVR